MSLPGSARGASAFTPLPRCLESRKTVRFRIPDIRREPWRSVVRFHAVGGPEVLKLEEIDVPPPGPGEVQIRVHALGLNRAEAMFRSGQYLEEPKLPARLGYEAAGAVAAIGPGVQGFQVGDAVSTIPSFSLNAYGLYGELANAPVHAVVHHPASLSWEEAAAVWMQYLTAYGALIDIGGAPGGRVRRHPRGVEQRRAGRHPDRQQGAGGAHRPHARSIEAAGHQRRRSGARGRHRRAGPGAGSEAYYRR